ncbi:MAG: class I tRNA ligase family protein [Verrucomicrobiales bacterium]|nr:class I tRNA ligase family protein [Verrucomicrobiales bacterium]
MSKRLYITTAIDYLNGQPHLGHAYEKVITDVIARARRSMGQDVFFLTGLDEHGQKVQQAAIAEGKVPQAYCDELAASWRAFATKLNLSNNDFIRTTEARHKQVVQALLLKLFNEDRNRPEQEKNIYKAEYRGFYSARQETFLTEKDRLPDGTFDPIYGEVLELVEENYYFRLSKYQGWLLDFLRQNRDFIYPGSRWNEIIGFLAQPLEDLCITRPKARLSWGIPLPFDANFVTYVWFDALVNYITVPASLGDPTILKALAPYLPAEFRRSNGETRLWESSEQAEVIHVIGKDIVKFHAVYWPIMLEAAGLPLPKKLLAHGWWEKDGKKMSKTTGNVVDPVVIFDEWGVDAFRYYVVRELDIGPDGNWTDAGFRARYHAELANGLGNLVNRSLSMLKRYRNGVVPAHPGQNQSDVSKGLQAEAEKVMTESRTLLAQFQLQDTLKSIWGLVTRANQYVDQTAPFKLAKDASKADQLDEVLYDLAETCRILAVLLWPFVPDTASRIYAQLGLDNGVDNFKNAPWGGLAPGHKIGEPAPLFPRKDQPKGVVA